MPNPGRLVLALALVAWSATGCGGKAHDAGPAPTRDAVATTGGTAPATTAPEPAEAPRNEAPEDAATSGAVVRGDTSDENAPVTAAIAMAEATLSPGEHARALCAKRERCGCGDADCEAAIGAIERAVPEPAWPCILADACDTICAEGAVDACLAPEREAFEANLRASRVSRFCARHVQCRCPIQGCRTRLSAADHDELIAYATCATRLPCPAVCEAGLEGTGAGACAELLAPDATE